LLTHEWLKPHFFWVEPYRRPFALLPSRLHRKSLIARVGFALGAIQLLPAIRQSCNVEYDIGNVTSGGEPQPWPQANSKTNTYFIARHSLAEFR